MSRISEVQFHEQEFYRANEIILDWTRGGMPARQSELVTTTEHLCINITGSYIQNDHGRDAAAHQLAGTTDSTATDWCQCNFAIHRSLTI